MKIEAGMKVKLKSAVVTAEGVTTEDVLTVASVDDSTLGVTLICDAQPEWEGYAGTRDLAPVLEEDSEEGLRDLHHRLIFSEIGGELKRRAIAASIVVNAMKSAKKENQQFKEADLVRVVDPLDSGKEAGTLGVSLTPPSSGNITALFDGTTIFIAEAELARVWQTK